MSKEIRYYQAEAKEAVFTALKRGVIKQLVVMPGGTGKTVTACNIIKEFGRKLWISHEESLAEQSALVLLDEFDIIDIHLSSAILKNYGGIVELFRLHKSGEKLTSEAYTIINNIGIVKADLFDIDKPIVIASAQTLHKRLDLISQDHFEVIVTDEGDLFGSRTFKEPLDYLKPKLLLGITATDYRMDGVLMEDIFEEKVYEYTIQQAIKDQYLTELNGIVIQTTTTLDDIGTSEGDFNQKQLTEKINTLQRNNLIVNKYLEYCAGQQFICFGVDVQHVIDLHEAFQQKGINTAYVVSDKNRMQIGSDRKTIVSKYREGQILGLINFNIFSAGFDHPDCGCVILGCPTKSKRKFLQQLFRVTRRKSDEFVKRFGQIGTILDIVDGTSRHKLVNTRELDSGLEIEDRVFTSSVNKAKLKQARIERERSFETTLRKEDKKVDLLSIPVVKLNFSPRMQEAATEAQLKAIAGWGFSTEDVFYTKGQINEIFMQQSASDKQIAYLRHKGYDTSGFISKAQAAKAFDEIKNRK